MLRNLKQNCTVAILFSFLITPLLAQSTYSDNPKIIPLDIPDPTDSAGGIIVADLNGDSQMDYLVSVPGHITAIANNGRKLWTLKQDIVVGSSSESVGLPGHHGPGLAAADIDQDNKTEVLFLTKDGTLHIVDAQTGKQKATAKPPIPKGAQRWELVMPADFHGTGHDQDILLQATNKDSYRMGRYLAAYTYTDLINNKPPLWQTDQFHACAHNGVRLADLNGDKKDEILGPSILSCDGKKLTHAVDKGWHMDSVFVADVFPDKPGLEVIMLEEGANQIQVLSRTQPLWRKHFKKQEPQNAAVGRFSPDSNEIFIWCRSRYNEHQKPFVFNSKGKLVFDYNMDDVAPKGWTTAGVEVIHTIDWTGNKQQLACAKERHTEGDICLFEPLTGKFVKTFKEHADRLYVADVTGDWREEIIVLNQNQLHIYHNPAKNPHPDKPRKWSDRNYRRLKQYHNYYSP